MLRTDNSSCGPKNFGVSGNLQAFRMLTELRDTANSYPHDAISKLSDDVLLVIFHFYLEKAFVRGGRAYDGWHDLVHVCRRWRCLVFASPGHLDLRLLCSRRTPRRLLDIWPALPIVVQDRARSSDYWGIWGMTNTIAALDQHNRVCKIELYPTPNSQLDYLIAMRKPFPVLTDLELRSTGPAAPILPDSFLGGSAPRLQSLKLQRIPFPSLPRLLCSTTDLVSLHLFEIPRSGYISPVAIATALSMLTRLKSLHLDFNPSLPSAHVALQSQLPLKRIILPALTEFYLWSESGYMEDMVSTIDTPLLNVARIAFSGQPDSDTPLLRDFISRTEVFNELHRAKVAISMNSVHLTLSRMNKGPDDKMLKLRFSCSALDWRFSSLAQIFNSLLPPLPALEYLEVFTDQLYWRSNMENAQWLGLLRPFFSVKNLVLFDDLVRYVAPALKELTGERVSEVLPALQNVFLKGSRPSAPSKPVQEALEQFVVARQLSGRPVVLHYWGYRLERGARRVGEWMVLHKSSYSQ